MGSPTAPEGTRRYGASERPQSYLSPCDGHSIHDTNKQIPEEFTYPDCPDVRIPDCGELASNGIAHGNIEREFLDENHHTKERELFDTESIKQEPAIKQEVRFEDGKTFIDLTKEETSALPRRPMPNAKLIKAVYRHQKAEMRRLGPRQQESDSLFVQDNDPPRSMPNSAWLTPEPGEDDDSK